MEMLASLATGVALLFGGVLALRWLGLRLLHRFAPAWMVGPAGVLIDTTGRLGMLQMHEDPRARSDTAPVRPDGGGCPPGHS